MRRTWSLPVLPADTPAKRRVDHLLPSRGLPAVAYFATVAGPDPGHRPFGQATSRARHSTSVNADLSRALT